MKNTALNLTNWFLTDPRRAFVILSIIMIVLTLALGATSIDTAWAEDVVGGS